MCGDPPYLNNSYDHLRANEAIATDQRGFTLANHKLVPTRYAKLTKANRCATHMHSIM